jgi:hypothetical protein
MVNGVAMHQQGKMLMAPGDVIYMEAPDAGGFCPPDEDGL